MEMEARRYPDWRLEHLSIVTDILPERNHYQSLLEQTFFECIPALQSYT